MNVPFNVEGVSVKEGCGCGCAVDSVVPAPAVFSSAVDHTNLYSTGAGNAFLVSNLNNNGVAFGTTQYVEGNINDLETAPLPVLQAPSVRLAPVEGPLVTLSNPAIPAPKVIASRCVCTKTIVKPQVYQRLVTVPKIQRYLKRTVTPVVENLIYKSKPICSPNFVNAGVVSSVDAAEVARAAAPVASSVVISRASPLVVSESWNGKEC